MLIQDKRTVVIITLLISVFSSRANASWSEFVRINRETEAKYKLNVKTSILNNGQCTYQIEAPMVPKLVPEIAKGVNLHCWLIVCKSRMPKQPSFRNYIWSGNKNALIKDSTLRAWYGDYSPTESNILLKVPIVPNEEGILQFTLHKEMIGQSYVYIDYPGPIYDGGYYYSIDLLSYVDIPKKP